jgi:chemotaxis protein methyltransferase CheR
MADVMDTKMSAREFSRFSAFVQDTCGIHLPPEKSGLLETRLRKRLRALGINRYETYFDYLQTEGDAELRQFLDVVSTNKTEFFREAAHFDLLRKRVLPEWLNSEGPRRGAFRLWCAASSSGQEPYTLGMVLAEALPPGTDFRILGTDISTRILDAALTGRYTAQEVKAIPPTWLPKYFNKCDASNWVVGPLLRSKVRFARLNLNEGEFPFKTPFDAIFCRNVMIYFDLPTQESLVRRLSTVLKPGGWLFSGMAESLLSIHHDLLICGPSAYRKKP